MERKAVKRDSLSKQVSDKLENMIEEGEYSVGQRIPTEPELMDMFQVSRNTIREAVQSLTWAGILEVKQGDGTYVRSSSRFRANMAKKYSQTSLNDIKEARNSIEVTIAHLAAGRRTEEDMVQIDEAYSRRKNLVSDIKENTRADMEFHMAIARACHNDILIEIYQSISDYLESHIAERNMDSDLSQERIDSLHSQLYMAVRNGNPDEASLAVQRILEI